jgi:hypothetical protein
MAALAIFLTANMGGVEQVYFEDTMLETPTQSKNKEKKDAS